MATWPVENTNVNSLENLSFSRTVITPSSSSSVLFDDLYSLPKGNMSLVITPKDAIQKP